MLRNLKEFKLPELEEKVLKFWSENQVFQKSLEKNKRLTSNVKRFNFFEGPPTANGRPGIHHVFGRAFKDLIPRYKTMRGFFVRRKAGWDTHGLPVEIEVEKALGLKQKQDIEKFGIAEFNERAKESVWKYKDEWEKLTERIGFLLDLKNPYVTYHPDYIESLWWVFKQIAKRGILTKSFKIVPYCPRCQTPLSSHEMGQPGVYKKVKDPSIWVKFRVQRPASSVKNEYFLIWTTTPWTLSSNAAVAVNPALTYTKYQVGKEFLWAYRLPPGVDGEVVEKVSGKKLIGLKYQPLFRVTGPWLKNKNFFKVYAADFVSTEEGTGLVHIAPAFGEDDMNLIKTVEKDLVGKIPMLVDERGILAKGLPGGGKFVKQADKDIIDELQSRGLLLKSDFIEHEYPHCWRCGTPLLYFSQFSWFIEMSRLRAELLKNNEKINWIPNHIKEGRFGEWLREVKDWAISRNRYWGTPLPIWVCESRNEKAHANKGCGHIEVIGSLQELNEKRYSKNRFFLTRHGEAEHNLKNVIASGPERGTRISKLTDRGKKAVSEAAENLKRLLGREKLDLIFTSPYFRTRQTAQIFAKLLGGKIVVEKRLSEINCGIFNWQLVLEHKKFFANPLEQFSKTPSGGENLSDVKRRALEAILEINSKYKDKNILIVSHSDPVWVLRGTMLGLSDKEILESDYLKVNGDVRETELRNWPYNQRGELDLHRPYVDNLYLKCPKCRGRMERVKEVADVWFDSGAMPLAQFHYPWNCPKAQSSKLKAQSLGDCIDFPADYICEAVDQTRGWFYTLLAVATALGLDDPPFKNVLTYGILLDKHGLKMSKSKGNTVDPWEMIRKYGADVVRWYFYSSTVPCESKSFDEADLGKKLRQFVMIIYNSFVFYDIYRASSVQRPASSNDILDKWVVARLNQTMVVVTENLEKYEIGVASKAIEIFVDDLSRWYIRRSRPRFQKPENLQDHEVASATLYGCLLKLSKLLAPFTPFFAEALYRSLESNVQRPASVHLEDWPLAEEKMIDYELLEKMEEVRRLSSLALALRAEKGVRIRQPLRILEVRSEKLDIRDGELLKILKNEVNVKEVSWNQKSGEDVDFDFTITPALKEEGTLRELVRMVQGLRHDAKYVPRDQIVLMLEVRGWISGVVRKNEAAFKKDVGAKIVEYKKSPKFDAELETKLDDEPIWLGVRRL